MLETEYAPDLPGPYLCTECSQQAIKLYACDTCDEALCKKCQVILFDNMVQLCTASKEELKYLSKLFQLKELIKNTK
eukprot:UN16784